MSSKNDREMHNLPLLPLRGVVIFPGSVTTLDVGREKSMAAVEEAEGALTAMGFRDFRVRVPDGALVQVTKAQLPLARERWADLQAVLVPLFGKASLDPVPRTPSL